MEDQPALATELFGAGVEFDDGGIGGQPRSGPVNSGDAMKQGDTSTEYPPILILQDALAVFDLFLSAGYLMLWYVAPASLAETVAGISGAPLFLGCLAVLTGGWIRHQGRQPGRTYPGAAWTIFGIFSGLLLAILATGFPAWMTFTAML